MNRENLFIFMAGRGMALVALLGFQILLVRALPPAEYATYALVFAFATLMQTAVSLGIPRLIPKYVGQAGITLPNAIVRNLAKWLLIIRVAGSLVLMAATLAIVGLSGLAPSMTLQLAVTGSLFILVGLVQMDADAMAQALQLQRVSRNCGVAEALARLILVAVLNTMGLISTATDVLHVSILTASIASGFLLVSVFRALSRESPATATGSIIWRELRAAGLGGYASSMAWFASSPAVIRLIGGHMLAVVPFAGFAFAQSLILSFQRYTPGMLLFPFIEPAVMRDYARTGDQTQLERALALMTKIDIVIIGAAIVGTLVAGRAIVDIITDNRYGDLAYTLPWLLTYIVLSSIYRSFEIVAVALGASSVLVRTLAFSLVWLVIALILTPRFGLIVLLACPIADAVSRLWLTYHELGKIGVRHAIDLRATLTVVILVATLGGLGAEAVQLIEAPPIQAIGIGILCGLLYLAVVIALKPVNVAEVNILVGQGDGAMATRLRNYARP